MSIQITSLDKQKQKEKERLLDWRAQYVNDRRKMENDLYYVATVHVTKDADIERFEFQREYKKALINYINDKIKEIDKQLGI